jgi:hypothetical protein
LVAQEELVVWAELAESAAQAEWVAPAELAASEAWVELAVQAEPTVPPRSLPAETAGTGSIIPNIAAVPPIGTGPLPTGLVEPLVVIHSRNASRVRVSKLAARAET